MAWKKAREKMQEHAKSKWHNEACLLAAEYEHSQKEGTIADRMQSASNDQEQKIAGF